MLIKAAGSVCIFCGSLWFGFYRGSLLRKREKYLLDIKSFLHLLEVEIQFSACRLQDIFRKIAERTALVRLTEQTLERLASDGIRLAWERAVDKECSCLTQADRDVIKMLGAELGMTDRENQIKNIKHIETLIEKQHEEAQEQRRRLCKLYEGGGALLGLLVIVLLL